MSSKKDIYKGDGPKQRYYFVSSRKIVPNQKNKDGTDNEEFLAILDKKYNVVDKPLPRNKESNYERVDYKKVRSIDNPIIYKKLLLSDVDTLADTEGWKLSPKARRALVAWDKTQDELKDILKMFKESDTKCNYLDYNISENRFFGKCKTVGGCC